MDPTYFNLYGVIVLFVAMTGLQIAGHAVARRAADRATEPAVSSLGAVEGAVFGLLALLLGFSFSSAVSRFEARKELIVAEAVSLGSTWQWFDLLNGSARDELRTKFRDYTDTRIQIYRNFRDEPQRERLVKVAERQEVEIWAQAIAASKAQGLTSGTIPLLSALSETFDIATRRFATLRAHVPGLIFVLLIGMSLGCSFLAGYSVGSSRRRHWIAILAFSFLMALTIYVVLDLEFPRLGLIRVDGYDALIIEARAAMQ